MSEAEKEETGSMSPPTKATAAPKAKAKAKAKKKDDGEKTARRSKFADLYPDAATIALTVEENPKKEGSAARERFQHYFNSKTVADYLAAGGTYADIAYDVGRAFIVVTK